MVKRYGQVIRLKPGVKDEYVRYHANVWPEVLQMIHDCNIRNYSIFLKDDTLIRKAALTISKNKKNKWETISMPI